MFFSFFFKWSWHIILWALKYSIFVPWVVYCPTHFRNCEWIWCELDFQKKTGILNRKRGRMKIWIELKRMHGRISKKRRKKNQIFANSFQFKRINHIKGGLFKWARDTQIHNTYGRSATTRLFTLKAISADFSSENESQNEGDEVFEAN